MMLFKETMIPDCYEVYPKIITDTRGQFIKTFNQDFFSEQKLETQFAEDYLSLSKKRVLRGLHFQLPPHDHIKLVYCIGGEVIDVLVDLRQGSPAYGKPQKFKLSASQANGLYIPKGIAHGFYTLTDGVIMQYKTSTVHNPASDAGISWKSFDIWDDHDPILSERDQKLPLLRDFQNPFYYVANT